MASLDSVPNLDVAMNDLHGFVEDAQTATPEDFDSLQELLREEHNVPRSLHSIIINLGRVTDTQLAYYRTKGRLPGERMDRALLLSTRPFFTGEQDSTIELRAITHHIPMLMRSKSKMSTSLSLRDSGASFDVAYSGNKRYLPYSGVLQDKLFAMADKEYEEAQAGQGDFGAAFNLIQEALKTTDRSTDNDIQSYLATTAILASSLLEAIDR